MNRRRMLSCIALATVLMATPAFAQGSGAGDPRPRDAIPAILAAFEQYSVVAMMAGHGIKDADDLVLSLVRQRGFPDVVNDVVVECTNSMYQSVLDRYIAGEDVPFESARQAWYNTQPGCSDFHEALFPLIRRINQRLPVARRLRVLAGEPSIDWNAVTTEAQVRDILGSGARERSMASVVEREVLGKHRKALLLYGTTH